MVEQLLANPVWHALTTVQRGFARSVDGAVAYLPDVSVFSAAERLDPRGWTALAELHGARGIVVALAAEPTDPPGFLDVRQRFGVLQMAADGPIEAPIPEHRVLGPADVPSMLALVRLTEPGPFEVRTPELGTYRGVFDGERLVAMAGERLRIEGATEISAVCTHPDARRRGLGAGLTAAVAAGIRARDELAMLHVAASNTGAIRVYDALGFRVLREVEVLVARVL